MDEPREELQANANEHAEAPEFEALTPPTKAGDGRDLGISGC